MTQNQKAELPKQVGRYNILQRVYETRWEDLYHARDLRALAQTL